MRRLIYPKGYRLVTACIRRMGKVMFSFCLSVHTSRGGGYLPSGQGGVPTFLGLDGGYLPPGWGVPTFPGPDRGVPTFRVGGGVTYLLGRGGTYLPRVVGTPPHHQGRYPPPPEQHGVRLLRGGRYALLRSRRRTFLYLRCG